MPFAGTPVGANIYNLASNVLLFATKSDPQIRTFKIVWNCFLCNPCTDFSCHPPNFSMCFLIQILRVHVFNVLAIDLHQNKCNHNSSVHYVVIVFAQTLTKDIIDNAARIINTFNWL